MVGEQREREGIGERNVGPYAGDIVYGNTINRPGGYMHGDHREKFSFKRS